MKPPYQFLVRPLKDKRYDNTMDVGGIELITSVDLEDHRFTTREAEVLATPATYNGPIEVGDTIFVHHNVFKYYFSMKHGTQESGKSFFRPGTFLIDDEQYFMYRKDGKLFAKEGFTFGRGVLTVDSDTVFGSQGEHQMMVEVTHPSQGMRDLGVSEGDLVCHVPKVRYAFRIDGELLYRFYNSHITLKV